MSEWQPIETAPKDGTEVLMYFPNDPMLEGFSEEEKAVVPCGYIFISIWYEEENAWVDPVDFDINGKIPTHWMSMPEPPSSIKGEER